jgi:hypothetical protein
VSIHGRRRAFASRTFGICTLALSMLSRSSGIIASPDHVILRSPVNSNESPSAPAVVRLSSIR